MTIAPAAIELVTHDMTADQAAQTLDKALAAQARMKELIAAVKQSLIEWMIERGVHEIEIGKTTYYYLGEEKIVKCRDNARALEKAFDLCGGDFAGVAALLSSSADTWKQGAFRRACQEQPELFDQLFETTFRPVLKDGRPAKKLVGINKEFLQEKP